MANDKYQPLGGYVTSPRDFIGKQRKIDSNGLFSETIFGPQQSYICSCGNYNAKVLYKGKVCPKCGVLCDSNDLRYTTFGKIKTVFPFIKPNKREKFLKIIGHKNSNIIDPNRADYLNSTHRYIGIHQTKLTIKIFTSLDEDNTYLIIPFRITGIYSLYLVLKFLKDYMNVPQAIEAFDEGYIVDEVGVTPPNLRLVTYDESKKEVRTPEINKHYTCLLRMNKSHQPIVNNLPIDEEDWLGKIQSNLKNKILDQDIVETAVIEYDMFAAKYQWFVNCIYQSIYDELSGKFGLIRNSILGKNIEFSARTVICVDPSLPPYQVRVSKKILKKLWAPYFIYYLTSVKQFDYDICYEDMLLNEEMTPAFNKMFDEFLQWMQDDE